MIERSKRKSRVESNIAMIASARRRRNEVWTTLRDARLVCSSMIHTAIDADGELDLDRLDGISILLGRSPHVLNRYKLSTKSLFERVDVPLDLLIRRHADLPISTIRRAQKVRQMLSITSISASALVAVYGKEALDVTHLANWRLNLP